jgi:hypothetical protein
MMTFAELFEGRTETSGVRRSARIPYLVESWIGDLEESLILLQAAATLPTEYDGLLRTSIDIDERINEKHWRIIAAYDEYESTYSFDTGGGTQHITNSITTRNRYAASGTPPDLKGAIAYDGQNVNGVDIIVPVYNFSETHYFNDTQVTPAYKATLFRITGTVNNDPFRGFSPGEVLFLGASGCKRGTDLWELQFRFASLPNQENFTVGDITVTTKKGWDYMWVLYDNAEDSTAKKLVKRPKAVYIEQVYPEKSFADLGLG